MQLANAVLAGHAETDPTTSGVIGAVVIFGMVVVVAWLLLRGSKK